MFLAWILLVLAPAAPVRAAGSGAALAQEPAHAPAGGAASAPQAEAEHAEDESHAEGESIWRTIARLLNFVILVGGLGYLLRTPLANYLERRRTQINRDLVEAEDMRQGASAQIAEIDAKLRALPGDLDALKKRGADEVAAEEVRIRKMAAAERDRLLERTRREIGRQVRVARQELTREAADLAVGAAAGRIRRHLTPDGHLRLVDRYAEQVREAGWGTEK